MMMGVSNLKSGIDASLLEEEEEDNRALTPTTTDHPIHRLNVRVFRTPHLSRRSSSSSRSLLADRGPLALVNGSGLHGDAASSPNREASPSYGEPLESSRNIELDSCGLARPTARQSCRFGPKEEADSGELVHRVEEGRKILGRSNGR
jgi:hypothetical protein